MPQKFEEFFSKCALLSLPSSLGCIWLACLSIRVRAQLGCNVHAVSSLHTGHSSFL